MFHLKLSAPSSEQSIERDHQHHDSKPGKDGRPHGEVEEDKREDDLERSRPDHVDVPHQVHQPLSVHGHQVDNLSHRAGPTSLVAETKSLVERMRWIMEV